MMHNIILTLERIQQFISRDKNECYMCQQGCESLRRLLFQCPLTKYLWWTSPWNIKTEAFKDLQVEEWTLLLMNAESDLNFETR